MQRAPAMQALPHEPQLILLNCVFVQTPVQYVKPAMQVHAPAMQLDTPEHVVPHVPQFVELVCRSTQLAPQSV